MTYYGTDSTERTWVPLIIGAVAVVSAWVVTGLLDLVGVQIPWYLESPSPLLLFGVALTAFDRRYWRRDLFRRLGIVRVPDIQGPWVGEAISATGHQVHVQVAIVQTWRALSIHLATGNSTSRSTVAAIFVGDPAGPILTYQYQNQPAATAEPELHAHVGTATLSLNGDQLSGEYYNGRDRATQGTLRMRRA